VASTHPLNVTPFQLACDYIFRIVTTMSHIGIRAVKANLSEYVAEVQAGHELTITSHGKPVARLVPIRAQAGADVASRLVSHVDALAEEGLLDVPVGALGWAQRPLVTLSAGPGASQMVSDDRR